MVEQMVLVVEQLPSLIYQDVLVAEFELLEKLIDSTSFGFRQFLPRYW